MPIDPNAVRCADCGANPIGPDGHPDLRHSTRPGGCMLAKDQLRLEVLREVEWSSSATHSNTYGGYCPVCHGNRSNHSPQCRLAAAIKE
jgi:hypothetical protein